MTYQASHRFARISPRKARLITDLVRGEDIESAMAALEFSKRRGAYYLKNVLKSAIANAEEKDLVPWQNPVSDCRSVSL